MKILVVARYFAPENSIASIRPTKMAKYLSRLGHDVTVLTLDGPFAVVDDVLAQDISSISHVVRVKNSNIEEKMRHLLIREVHGNSRSKAKDSTSTAMEALKQKKTTLRARVWEASSENPFAKAFVVCAKPFFDCYYGTRSFISAWVARQMRDWKDEELFTRYRRFLPEDEVYDIVFSTWEPTSTHQITMDMVKRGKAKHWIADFRDPMRTFWYTTPKQKQETAVAKFLQEVYHCADGITVVSDGILDSQPMPTDIPVWELTNGFDPEDLHKITPWEQEKGKLHLVYAGQLYGGASDLTPIFQALRSLADEGKLDRKKVCFHFAGSQGALFKGFAQSAGMEDIVCDHGYVGRADSLALQNGCDILVFASWNTEKEKSVFTGKFFEYMMMQKPILCCMSGNVPNSSIKKMLEKDTELGFCFERANAEQDMVELKQFLLAQYESIMQTGAALPILQTEAVLQYSHPVLAKKLESYMLEVCSKSVANCIPNNIKSFSEH